MTPAPEGTPARRSPFLVVLVVVASLAVVCLLVTVLVAVPRYVFARDARRRQSECKTNLKAIFTGEKALFGEQNEYSPHVSRIGFDPERRNRYAYFLDTSGPLQEQGRPALEGATGWAVDHESLGVPTVRLSDVPALPWKPGVEGVCPRCEVTALCAGNIDADPQLDVWSISTKERIAPDGELIPSGVPYNDLNDTR